MATINFDSKKDDWKSFFGSRRALYVALNGILTVYLYNIWVEGRGKDQENHQQKYLE